MKAHIGFEGKEEINIPFESLKKHFIALGSSGSGKTVICKILIEEAAKNKIPSIIIDPQGDLASLALGEEKLKSKIMIYTPTSGKGIPLSLNPLSLPKKDIEEDELISILNTISSSLCELLGYNIEKDNGKSAVAFIYDILKTKVKDSEEYSINELISLVEENKDNEFLSDKEIKDLIKKLKLLTVGEKELLFNYGESLNIKKLLENDISIIYLNSLKSFIDKDFYISILTTKLYEYMLENPSKNLQALFYIDEISTFLPAGNKKTLSKNILNLMYKQGRKYGIGCIVSTQNPGDIDYKAFSQFSNWAIGRLTSKQDREKLKITLKSLSDNFSDIESTLPKLKPGEFLLFSPDNFDSIKNIKTKWLLTEHKTLTLNDIDEIMKKYKKNIKALTKTNQKEIPIAKSKGPKHFSVHLSKEEINNIVDKNKKKLFIIFGPEKEKIESTKLDLVPFYKTKIRAKTSKLMGLKKSIDEHIIFFDGLTGEPIQIKMDNFKNFKGFSKLKELSEDEIEAIKLLNNKDNISLNEIAFKLNKSTKITNNILKKLQDKKLITYDNKSGSTLWSILIDINVPNKLSKIESLHNSYSDKNLEGDILKPKINIKDIEKIARTWFGTAELIDSEIIYYPVYEISYISKKGLRKIKISAVNGSLFCS